MVKSYRNHSKVFRKPKRPFEKERLAAEMKLIGTYGLKNKREVWRVQYVLAKLRSAARHLLTLEAEDPKRQFQGASLLRRMERLGLLSPAERQLDFVLGLTPAKLMERRLQTLVFKTGMAKSIHHARVLIRGRHVRVGARMVNVPSFMARVDSAKHIDFAINSPLQPGGRPGRVKRKKLASGGAAAEEDEE